MADDIDSGLSVNFYVSASNKTRQPQKERERIKGNRGQRIKARKSLKRFKEHNSVSLPKDDGNILPNLKNDNVTTNSPGKDTDRNRKVEDGTRKKTGVISSLFRHNPEIPSVASNKVNPVKESLFSSDSFQEVPLHPYMVSNLEKLGFTKMTAVQHQTLPKLLSGADLMVKSQTGSGKTMAYAIPIIEDLCRRTPKVQRKDGTLALVIVPTRELALQSYEVFVNLLKPFIWLVPCCIIGGEKRKAEKTRLRKGVNILIGTPGRLIDHIENTQSMLLDKVKWLVLDEADRLLDLGFEEKVSKIVTAVDKQSQQRQTVLLSATLTQGVERLAGISMKTPQRIDVAGHKDTLGSSQIDTVKQDPGSDVSGNQSATENISLPESLQQYFVIMPCKLRLVTLLSLILTKCKKSTKTKMIVFISTQDAVEFLYRLVRYLASDHQSSDVEEEEEQQHVTNYNVYRLHGDMAQKERTSMFHDFCTARSGVLLCTDVAARGLHLPALEWVVQYSCSTGTTNYVHRVGRTARAGTTGTSVMFVMPSESSYIQMLNQSKISLDEMKMGELLKDIVSLVPLLPGTDDTQRHLPKSTEETATYLQNCCENYVKNDKDMMALAKRAYQSYVRGYATYPHHLKSVFHVKHLHLGHVAKTFGLREAPSNISGIPGVNQKSLLGKRKHKDDQRHKKKSVTVSEFSSPLVFSSNKKPSSKGPKKRKK